MKHEKLRLPTHNKENCNASTAIPKTPSNSSISSTKSTLLSSLKKPDFSLLACVSTPRAAARRATTRKRRACDAKRETGTAESEVRDGGAVIIHTW